MTSIAKLYIHGFINEEQKKELDQLLALSNRECQEPECPVIERLSDNYQLFKDEIESRPS